MLSSGNGKPYVCANNLLKTHRYSVPYERIKGIDAFIDAPASTRNAEIAAEAEWLIDTYEPRAKVNDISIVSTNERGDFDFNIDLIIEE